MTRAKSEIEATSNGSGTAAIVSDTLDHLSQVWGAPEIRAIVTVRLSQQLRTSLGRANPVTGQVAIHPLLRFAPPEVLREVLCHEIAHVVAYRRARAITARRPR